MIQGLTPDFLHMVSILGGCEFATIARGRRSGKEIPLVRQMDSL